MKFSFLTAENLGKKYRSAKSHTESFTDPFPELERLARNKPHAKTDARYPKTTDGTTASIIRKTGRRVVQQLPTGKIESDEDDAWLPIIAEFVYTNQILPYANEEYDLIQKCWNAIERGLTFGSAAIFSPFISHSGHFSPDMTLPYWGDVFLQPGKKSGYACDYVFLRSWWQEEDIDSLIDKEQKLAKSAKRRSDDELNSMKAQLAQATDLEEMANLEQKIANFKPEKYESSWDLEALKEVKTRITSKDQGAITPAEKDAKSEVEGIEMVTGYQCGVGAKFFTFVPSTGSEMTTTIVRTKTNKDPRGKMPVDWFYADTDGSNPLGRGIVELIAGLQNLIDSDMQMYQYNRALMLAPPIIKRGSFSKKKIIYAPNAIIDMGTDPDASIETLNVDTSAVINYPDLYGLQKSQLLNLVASPDTSISAEVGNPGFGKTPSAINAQQATVSVDDNFTRKMFEAMWENWSETAINLYFAERHGVEELQLDSKTADRLRKLADEGKFDPSQLSDDDKIMIDYDSATPALTFRVDASTSKMKDDAAQGEILTSLIKGLDSSQVLSSIVPPEKVAALWNRLVSNSGVEDPEDMSIDIQELIQQQQEAEALQQQQMAMQSQLPTGQEPIEGEVVEPGMEQMPQEMPMEQPMPMGLPVEQPMPQEPTDPQLEQLDMIGQMLEEAGVPESLIAEAQSMAADGATPDEVFAALEEVIQRG